MTTSAASEAKVVSEIEVCDKLAPVVGPGRRGGGCGH